MSDEVNTSPYTGQPATEPLGPAPQPAAANAEISVPGAETPSPVVERNPAPKRHLSYEGGWPASMQSLVVTIVIAVFVITFIVQAFQIPSESMQNTLLIGDYLLVDKVHYGTSEVWGKVLPYEPVRRGDIIVFRYPIHPQEHFVKRVVGVPGDRIRLSHKRLYVDGKLQDEPYVVYNQPMPDSYRDNFPNGQYLVPSVEARWYLQMKKLVEGGELIVPTGHYFVLGDNRDESLDSRYWGFVPEENVIGRPLIIYFSMQVPRDDGPEQADDKLSRFAYVLTHLFQNMRWTRTLRVVR